VAERKQYHPLVCFTVNHCRFDSNPWSQSTEKASFVSLRSNPFEHPSCFDGLTAGLSRDTQYLRLNTWFLRSSTRIFHTGIVVYIIEQKAFIQNAELADACYMKWFMVWLKITKDYACAYFQHPMAWSSVCFPIKKLVRYVPHRKSLEQDGRLMLKTQRKTFVF